MQIHARQELVVNSRAESKNPDRLTWIEARRQQCRQARFERYQMVMELAGKGRTQLAIAAQIGIDSETISRWLKAGGFPERRIRSDRRTQIPVAHDQPCEPVTL
jgi:hypothetical protein